MTNKPLQTLIKPRTNKLRERNEFGMNTGDKGGIVRQ